MLQSFHEKDFKIYIYLMTFVTNGIAHLYMIFSQTLSSCYLPDSQFLLSPRLSVPVISQTLGSCYFLDSHESLAPPNMCSGWLGLWEPNKWPDNFVMQGPIFVCNTSIMCEFFHAHTHAVICMQIFVPSATNGWA